jgi:hypothetical protein
MLSKQVPEESFLYMFLLKKQEDKLAKKRHCHAEVALTKEQICLFCLARGQTTFGKETTTWLS